MDASFFDMTKWTEDDLKWAFDTVQQGKSWRDPIATVINPHDRDIVAEAIRAKTGQAPAFKALPSGGLEVRTEGLPGPG
jgi:hypothetical protein